MIIINKNLEGLMQTKNVNVFDPFNMYEFNLKGLIYFHEVEMQLDLFL